MATGGSLNAQNLRLRGRPPPTICARLDRPVNALLPLTVFRQRNFVADFLRKKSTYIRETAILRFGAQRQRTMFILGLLESA